MIQRNRLFYIIENYLLTNESTEPSSRNKLNSVFESRKTLILQGCPGFLLFTGYKMATSGHFFVAIIVCGYGIKLSGYFGLLVRVQMAVGFHGGLHPFVSQAFCYQKWRTAHVNQQTGVGMAYIVHPDLLCSGVVTTILHLSADPAPIIREDTVCRLYIVELCQIVFQTAFQYLRHNNFTVASFCLRRIDIVFSVQTLVVLVDRNNVSVEIIPRSSRTTFHRRFSYP